VSRACLLTGRVADRHGLKDQLPGIEGNYGPGLSSRETLIPQLLKQAGYSTGCFGKWNIGFAEGSRPTERGFDEFLGHASGNIDYYSHKYNGKHDLFHGIQPVHVEGYSTDLFADAAIQFITKQQSDPWFVYLPFNAPHFPNARNKEPGEAVLWQAPDAAFQPYGYDPKTTDPQERYHAVVTALDSSIGRLFAKLRELRQEENTFVLFFSDNGAFMLRDRGLEVASNKPLRDGGVTCWEGGIRVAAFARWPGRFAAGRVIAEPMWSPDLLPTCVHLSGSGSLETSVRDGTDILPVLEQKNSPRLRRSLYFTYRQGSALRMGDWKILRTKPGRQWQLLDLSRDAGESIDLAEQNPVVREKLIGEFKSWQASIAQASKARDASIPGRPFRLRQVE
jgi:arylsulfatase A